VEQRVKERMKYEDEVLLYLNMVYMFEVDAPEYHVEEYREWDMLAEWENLDEDTVVAAKHDRIFRLYHE
jgi:hypothetical protein